MRHIQNFHQRGTLDLWSLKTLARFQPNNVKTIFKLCTTYGTHQTTNPLIKLIITQVCKDGRWHEGKKFTHLWRIRTNCILCQGQHTK